MSKGYLALIAALAVAVLGVGAFAYFRSQPGQTPPPTYQPSPSSTPSPTPSAPLQNQIALTVTTPKNNGAVFNPKVTVSGKTAPNADVAVNDQDVRADAAGNFSAIITLDEGENEILVTASDSSGNYSEWQGTVTYTSAQ